MPDREKVICHLNDCMEESRPDNAWVFVRKDIVEDTIALLKEQEEVVRCKDCVKRPYDNCPFNEFSMYQPDDDFYCGLGSREWVESKDD